MKNLVALLLLPILAFSSDPAVYAQQEGTGALSRDVDALVDEGKTDKAVELVREALKADPNNPELSDRLGYLLLKGGRPDEAINAFDSALKINPRSRTSRTGMGLALFRKGDLKGAEAVLNEALTLNPYPASTHYALGLVYEQMNDYGKAVHHYKEGIRTYKSGKK